MATIKVTTRTGSKVPVEIDQFFYLLISIVARFLPGIPLGSIYQVMRTLGFLILFLLAAPLPLLISTVTLIINCFRSRTPIINPDRKRVLISGGGMTKALQLARTFHAAGHYVVLTDDYPFTAHRFSRSVSKFYVCEDSDYPSKYLQSIIDIVRKERIDVYVPVSHSSTECVDAEIKQALIPLNCQTFHGDPEQLAILSDKYRFIHQAQSYGLTVPKSMMITHPDQVLNYDFTQEKRPFILKSMKYNTIHRDRLVMLPCPRPEQTMEYVKSLNISEESPWIMQEYISGKEYCTHGAVRNGQLRVYVCCASSPWLLNYKHLHDKPLILNWVKEFCSKMHLTGQASFDFIESDVDGLPYPLECNPRTHTAITTLYNNPNVAQGYLDDHLLLDEPIQPSADGREIYWLYHELWHLFKVKTKKDLINILKRFVYGKEAIYSIDDPLPFLLQYTMHLPIMLCYSLFRVAYFRKIDCNLGLLL